MIDYSSGFHSVDLFLPLESKLRWPEVDVAAGANMNTATAESDQTNSVRASATIGVEGGSGSKLTMQGAAAPVSYIGAGELLTLTYTILNASDDQVTNVLLSHPTTNATLCEVGLLSPTFEAICTAVYTTTDSDAVSDRVSIETTLIYEGAVKPQMTTIEVPRVGAP